MTSLPTTKKLLACLFLALTSLGASAQSKEDASCRTVRFVDIGWTDITSTTALASVVFQGLGYDPKITQASVPISLAGLKTKQIDVSLGYWWPVQEKVGPAVHRRKADRQARPAESVRRQSHARRAEL